MSPGRTIEKVARLGRLERPTSGSGGEESDLEQCVFSRLDPRRVGVNRDIRAHLAASMQLSVQLQFYNLLDLRLAQRSDQRTHNLLGWSRAAVLSAI
jgi:hypothetical protein